MTSCEARGFAATEPTFGTLRKINPEVISANYIHPCRGHSRLPWRQDKGNPAVIVFVRHASLEKIGHCLNCLIKWLYAIEWIQLFPY